MFAKIHHISSLLSYDGAHAYYQRALRPMNKSRGYYVWNENERPLVDRRKHHYRIVQGPDASYYGLVLYQTVMVLYHAPAADGTRRVQVRHHGSTTSKQFLARMGWYHRSILRFSDGTDCAVPLVGNGYREVARWALDMCELPDGVYDKERSWHAPLARRVTSPEVRKYRRALLNYYDPYITLLATNTSTPAQAPRYVLWAWATYFRDLDDAFRAGDGGARGEIVAHMRDHLESYLRHGGFGPGTHPKEARQYLRSLLLKHTQYREGDAIEYLAPWLPTYPRNVFTA